MYRFQIIAHTQTGESIGLVGSTPELGLWDFTKNPAFLNYSPEAGRIYHSKWSGLSFTHEVEETDDPTGDMSPVHERMRVRYIARSERFWYATKCFSSVQGLAIAVA
jgi:Starch binding domain